MATTDQLFHVWLQRGRITYHTTVRAGDADEARTLVAQDRGEEPTDRWSMLPAADVARAVQLYIGKVLCRRAIHHRAGYICAVCGEAVRS